MLIYMLEYISHNTLDTPIERKRMVNNMVRPHINYASELHDFHDM
jgi:hypothetical protein